jgi:hypothetical protein
MYKLFAVLLFTGVVFAGVAGCRSAKKIGKVITAPVVPPDTSGAAARAALPVVNAHADSLKVIGQNLAGLAHNHVDFTSFSGHVHLNYEDKDGRDYDINAVVHIKKDSMIWVSINAALGFEALRILITKDSVKILDRLKKVVRLRSVNLLQEQVHLPVDFMTLQDLLLGNPIFLDTAHVLYYRKEPRGGNSLFSVGQTFTNFLTLNPDFTMQHSKLDDTDPLRARTCDMTYGDYDHSGAVPFSTYRKVSVEENGKVDIEFVYKQFRFNEALSYSFTIPKNYKRR